MVLNTDWAGRGRVRYSRGGGPGIQSIGTGLLPFSFLTLFAVAVLTQVLDFQPLIQYKSVLIAATVVVGLLAFWRNKEVLINALTTSGDLKKSELERGLPQRLLWTHKIPILGPLAMWIYKQGYPFNLLFVLVTILLAATYFSHIYTIRFIDTDEGRLIYDGKLILEGHIPFKDFNARAPFIIYFLAAYIALFGGSLFLIYCLPVLLVLGSAVLLYILSKRLFNEGIALATMLVFGFAPIVVNMLHLKTQTFELPIILASILLFDNYLVRKARSHLIYSGLLLLLALFSRETAIVFVPAYFWLVFFRRKLEKREVLKDLAALAVFFGVTYTSFRILTQLFFSYDFSDPLQESAGFSLGIDEDSKTRLALVPFFFSEAYLVLTTVSIGIIPLAMIQIKRLRHTFFALTMPFAIVLALVFAYTYRTLSIGFWPQYLMEFSPFYSLAIVLTVYGIMISTANQLWKWPTILLVAGILIISNINSYVDLKQYMGVNHRQGSSEIAEYINAHSDQDSIIFAGNPIIAYLSDRPQFMELSHTYYTPGIVGNVITELQQSPPHYIVVDPYLRIYYSPRDEFREFLASEYQMVKLFSAESYQKNWAAELFVRRTVLKDPPYIDTPLFGYKFDGLTKIPSEGWTDESGIVGQGIVSDPEGGTVHLEVEVQKVGTEFTGNPNCISGVAVVSGELATSICLALGDGSYHWQARAMGGGLPGQWRSAGENLENDADFVVLPSDTIHIGFDRFPRPNGLFGRADDMDSDGMNGTPLGVNISNQYCSLGALFILADGTSPIFGDSSSAMHISPPPLLSHSLSPISSAGLNEDAIQDVIIDFTTPVARVKVFALDADESWTLRGFNSSGTQIALDYHDPGVNFAFISGELIVDGSQGFISKLVIDLTEAPESGPISKAGPEFFDFLEYDPIGPIDTSACVGP